MTKIAGRSPTTARKKPSKLRPAWFKSAIRIFLLAGLSLLSGLMVGKPGAVEIGRFGTFPGLPALLPNQPALAQDPLIDINLPPASQPVDDPAIQSKVACVRLDGYCVFRVVAPKPDLPKRIQTIEQSLEQIQADYLNRSEPAADDDASNSDPDSASAQDSELELDPNLAGEIRTQPTETPPDPDATGAEPPWKAPEIYIGVPPAKLTRLMSVTRLDAEHQGVDAETAAEFILGEVQASLVTARAERQPGFLLQQSSLTLVILISLAALTWSLHRWERNLRKFKAELAKPPTLRLQPLLALLNQRQQWHFTEVQLRLSQLSQAALWLGGLLFILGRFPYTRIFQVRVIEGLHIPIELTLIGLGTYVVIRLSYALISRLTSALVTSYDTTPEANQRLRLRINTISRISRSILTITWLSVGSLLALSAMGINTVPIIAGASVIGVALSLAAQDLVKDVINGFLIILEDQYAVGDVITIHDIRGLVENMNLRITQIRDEEGRLVTVPNSEIRLIANHSSLWSRADLYVPIDYDTDVDEVIPLIQAAAETMSQDPDWQEKILDPPKVLGLEEFGERGFVIRIWIQTQPLAQWDVAREFRRRLKVTLDKAGIHIPAHIDFKAPRPSIQHHH